MLFLINNGGGLLVVYLSTILLSLKKSSNSSPSSHKEYNFNDLSLQIGVENYLEGNQLFDNGQYLEACNSYMDGILVGRRSVQHLIENQQQSSSNSNENDDNNVDIDIDNPELALDWLINSYINCCNSRIYLKDYDTARADAWAACSYSQNRNMEALQLMLLICTKTDDKFGQLQTYKLILSNLLVVVDGDDGKVETDDDKTISNSNSNDDNNVISDFTIEDLQRKIADLDSELMKEMRRGKK